MLRRAPRLDAFGQLGRPGPPLIPSRVPPSRLGGLAPSLLAAGRCASFVIDAAGALHTWGCPQASGLTDGALRGRRVRAIAAGEYHALALLADGALLTWGAGVGSPSTPLLVRGLPPSGATAIAAGYQHNLAIAPCTV